MLRALRARIESLAARDGRFGVACARTGVSPVPICGLWFENRETARVAARLASAYRARLRRFDDGVAVHDLVVHECPMTPAETDARGDSHGDRRGPADAPRRLADLSDD